MSNKVLITNSQKAIKVPSGLRILIRRACNAVLEYEHFDDENGGLEAMRMREKEEAVLTQLGLPRTVSYTE